jgi:hypothetical protein
MSPMSPIVVNMVPLNQFVIWVIEWQLFVIEINDLFVKHVIVGFLCRIGCVVFLCPNNANEACYI